MYLWQNTPKRCTMEGQNKNVLLALLFTSLFLVCLVVLSYSGLFVFIFFFRCLFGF